MFKYLLGLLALFLLITPVGAINISGDYSVQSFEDTKGIDVIPPENEIFMSVYVNNNPFGSNQTIYLDSGDKTYKLDISSWDNWGWKNFNVTLEYPNGTVDHEEFETFKPFAPNYDLKIQYAFFQVTAIDIDLYVGVSPFEASIEHDYDLTDYIMFDRVRAYSDHVFEADIYSVTEEQFKDIQDDPKNLIGVYTGKFFSWSWGGVIWFCDKIPGGYGDYLVDGLSIAGVFIDNTFYYFDLLFVQYFEITIMLIETFLIGDAIMRRGGLDVMLKRFVDNHVALVMFTMTIMGMAVNLVLGVVRAIAFVVNALKPI